MTQYQHTVDTITSNELDELQAERDRFKADYVRACATIAAMHEAAVGEVCGPIRGAVEDIEDVRTRAERAEAERDQARHATAFQRERASGLSARVEQAEAAIRSALPDLQRAIDCLDATCRYHGDCLDPDEYGRRYRAEACCDTGVEPRRAREARQTLDRLRAALDEHQEQP